MAALPEVQHEDIQQLTREQGRQMFDRVARKRLGMSGEEFIKQWDAGEYRGKADTPPISTVAILLPFGR